MAQPKPYRHYLRYFDIGANAYQYYYATSGTTDYTLTKTELVRAPEGWLDYEIGWERGFTYYGMYTSFATPLKFHKDGAIILRYLLYTNGIEGKCELLVEKFNSDSTVFDYETFFIGDIDLSKASDEFNYVVVPLMESGFPAKLKAREDTPYEFGIDGNTDARYIYNDGVDLQCKLFWSSTDAVAFSGNSFDELPLLYFYTFEGTNFLQKYYDVTQSPVQKRFIRNEDTASVDYTITLVGSYIITTGAITGTKYFTIRLIELDSTGVQVAGGVTDIYIDTVGITSGSTGIYNVNINTTYTLPSNHYLELGHFLAGGPLGSLDPNPAATNGFWATGVSALDLSVYFVNRYVATYHPTLLATDVMQYLITEIGKDNLGQADPTLTFVDNTISANYPDQIVITSGDGIRNFPNSKLKITFADLYKFLNTKFGVSFYYDKVNNTCYLNDKASVFIPSQGTGYGNVGIVNNLKIMPFISEAFVNLNIGNQNYSYDQKGDGINEVTNGKDEFNNKTVRLSPLVRVTNSSDYISPIRCDMYGIEFTRINYTNKTISDSSSDNEIFAIHKNEFIEGDFSLVVPGSPSVLTPYYLIYRDEIVVGTWEIENIFSPETAYNILFSPQRSLFRNGNYFRSLLKLNDSDYLNFQLSGMNNVDNLKMQTLTNGVIDFNEGEAVLISTLCANDEVLFQPVIFEFETKEVINLYNLIEDNPYNYITFTYLDNTYSGFIISAKSKPVIRGTTQFKLLATADTDLTQLIR